MNDNGTYINPEFHKFLDISRYVTVLQVRWLGYLTAALYLIDCIWTAVLGKYIPLVSVLSLLLFFEVFIMLVRRKKPMYTLFASCVLRGLFLVNVYMWLLVSATTLVFNAKVSLLLSQFALNYSDKLPTYLAQLTLIVLTLAFMIGLSGVVMDLVYDTMSGFRTFNRIPGEENRTRAMQLAFTVMFLLCTTFVFYFFGDYLWIFALDLLGDVSSLELLIVLIYIGYYAKVTLAYSPLKRSVVKPYNE